MCQTRLCISGGVEMAWLSHGETIVRTVQVPEDRQTLRCPDWITVALQRQSQADPCTG